MAEIIRRTLPLLLLLSLGPLTALAPPAPAGAQLLPSRQAPSQLEWFFPADQRDFDDAVPSPQAFLGRDLGTHHTRHARIVAYFRELARRSDRATYREIGETIELRPMPVLTVTSTENQGRLEEIRRRHLEATDPAADPAPSDGRPVIVHLGYGVHGNETSSSEAAMLAAYWLVAGRSDAVSRYRREAVVHVEPVLNPDGRDRHTHWANMHRAEPVVTDPLDREHNEVWPGGRTNHYWFDLNRDWLPLEQPESRARIDFHHRWRPNVVTDYHEMGTGSTYFFEPTEPELSWNHLLPEPLYTEITLDFAEDYAAALDAIGSRYFNREDRFDNTYPGYGSTYPNFLGGLGLVFEQASSRGVAQENPTHGVLTFDRPIRNHLRTSLATVRGAVERKERLLDHQRDFFVSALEEAEADPVGGWVFGDPHDPSRNRAFLDLLLRHRIEVYRLAGPLETGGRTFRPGAAWVVPAAQPQYRLARSIFERTDAYTGRAGSRASAWTMTLAYGMPDAEIGDAADARGERVTAVPAPRAGAPPAADAFAYLLDWSDYGAPRALHHLLARGVRAEAAFEPFTAATNEGRRAYPAGSVSIPLGAQDLDRGRLEALVREAADEAGVPFQSVAGASTLEGIDLGSGAFRPVEAPAVLMVVGAGTSGYEAGEVWHLLDTRVGMPITKVDRTDLPRVRLADYDAVVLVSGAPEAFADAGRVEDLRRWVRGGGTLVALRTAAVWAAENGFAPHVDPDAGPRDAEPPPPDPEVERRDYAEAAPRSARQRIAGVMVETDLDPTHPVAFGYRRRALPVWRDHGLVLPPSDNPYSTVARYTDEPRLSGFLTPENEERLRGTASVLADAPGEGSVVLFLDNPNFRGFWYGTNRLFLNALFLGRHLTVPAAPGG